MTLALPHANSIIRERSSLNKRNLLVLVKHNRLGYFVKALTTGPVKQRAFGPFAQAVDFNDGQGSVQIPSAEIINISGASPCPLLRIGDGVFAFYKHQDGFEIYLPGKIIKLPKTNLPEHRVYTVRILHQGGFCSKVLPRNKIALVRSNQFDDITGGAFNKMKSRRSKQRRKQKRRILRDTGTQTDGQKRLDAQTSYTCTSDSSSVQSTRSPSESDTDLDSSSRSSYRQPEATDDLDPGQRVLARWPDDGWFYYGVVDSQIEHDKYRVKDSTGYVSHIKRSNILLEEEQDFQAIQPGDTVVALHPNYIFSYAPGTANVVYRSGVHVQFYDDSECKLPRDEVFKITPEKYEDCVGYIRTCERRLCNQDAIVLDETSSSYRLRTVVSVSGEQEFTARPCTGSQDLNQSGQDNPDDTQPGRQKAIHVFPLNTRGMLGRAGDTCRYVLAPVDDTCHVYLPAEVYFSSRINNSMIEVSYCNGTIRRLTNLDECFYLSKSYFEFARAACRPDIDSDSGDTDTSLSQ